MSEVRITSSHNPWVKQVRRLHTRKGRREAGLFLAEGTRLLEEAQAADWCPERVFYAPCRLRTARDEAVLAGWRDRQVPCVELEERLLLELAGTESPQFMLAVFAGRELSLGELQPGAASRYLLLENLQDPGNVGVLLRSAQAVGVDAVLVVGGVDAVHPRSVRASMGAVFRVPLVTASWGEISVWLRRSLPRPRLMAAAPRATRSLYDCDWATPFLLAVGNEIDGVSPAMLDSAEETIGIPMPGGGESLNTAVAGSLLLYEALRRAQHSSR